MQIIRRKEVEDIDKGGYVTKSLTTKIFEEPPKDMGIYESRIKKGDKCREQWHNKSYELVYFATKGKAKLNGKIYNFEPGDCVILDPGEKHEWIAENNEVVLFAIRFPHLLDDRFVTEEEY